MWVSRGNPGAKKREKESSLLEYRPLSDNPYAVQVFEEAVQMNRMENLFSAEEGPGQAECKTWSGSRSGHDRMICWRAYYF